MTIRRLAGIATWSLLLRLVSVSADLACAEHHEGARASAPQHLHGQHESAPSGHDKPCNAPTRADCCQALVTCAVSLDCGATAHPSAFPDASTKSGKRSVATPPSIARAPDTPPPRAQALGQ